MRGIEKKNKMKRGREIRMKTKESKRDEAKKESPASSF